MPAFLEAKLKREYPNNPHAVYGTMNKIGAMRGNKITRKGLAMRLPSAERNALPARDFVFPKQRKFPIENASHARDALSRAGAKGGGVQSKVRAAVRRRFPGIKQKTVSLHSLVKRRRG